MAQNRVDNIQVNAPKDIDNKRGVWNGSTWRPYNDVAEANNSIPIEIRYRSLTVPIFKAGVPTDYYWKDGVSDGQLVEKLISNDEYVLPKATLSTLGGVIVGDGLYIDEETGVISTSGSGGGGGGGGGDGSVTSVGISSGDLNVTNSPITSSGNITLSVKNSIITFAKMQSIPQSTLIGRGGTGTGVAGVVTIGSGLNLNSSNVLSATGGGGGGGSQTLQQTLNAGRVGDKIQITESLQIPTITPSTINAGNIWIGAGTSGGGGGGGGGGTGTVTNVAMASTDFDITGSPINTTGTITANIKNSAVTLAKIQNVSTGVLLGRGGAGTGVLGEVTIGSGLVLNSSNVLSATGGGGGGGTVTNVSSANSDITVTNPTTTPTLTLNSSVNPTASTIVKRDGSGGIFFTIYGDKIVGGTQGVINYDAGTSGYGEHNFKVNSGQLGFKVNTDRTLTAPRYASGGTAPTTTGATKMMVVDTNGLFSFKNEPALSQTLQQTLDIGRIGDSMKITTSMEIPTVAPSIINAGNVWVGTGTSAGSLTKTKVNSLSDLTSTSLSIGSAEASKYLVSTNASAIAGTITSGTALTSVFVRQGGAGKITFTGSGVTVLVKSGKVARTEGQNAVVEIFYETTTRVVITGDLDT